MTDAVATTLACLWLLTTWVFKIRPLVIDRRQPLYHPRVSGSWADPDRWEDAA